MLVFARACFVLAILAGVCALLVRLVQQPPPLMLFLPVTWLKMSGLLFLASAASSLLEIAENMGKKA